MTDPIKKKLRYVTDKPQSGQVNMATDEAILLAVNDGKSMATLRFYQWSVPTISLGYFQMACEHSSQDIEISQMPVVRRLTGGGAILHDDELTYSLAIPTNLCLPVSNIEDLYRLVHDAFIDILIGFGIVPEYRGGVDEAVNSQRGPFFCFARMHHLDLVLGQDKLLGSAQRRIKNAVLQHGSLILARHFDQQPSAQVNAADIIIDLERLKRLLAEKISDSLGLILCPGGLSEAEMAVSQELKCQKYENDSWNRQR